MGSAKYSILGWYLLSHRDCNISSQSLLTYNVSNNNSGIILMILSLYVTWPLFLSAFKNLSLFCMFGIWLCEDFLFGSLYLVFCNLSVVFNGFFFSVLEKFSSMILIKIFSRLMKWASSPSSHIILSLRLSIVSPITQMFHFRNFLVLTCPSINGSISDFIFSNSEILFLSWILFFMIQSVVQVLLPRFPTSRIPSVSLFLIQSISVFKSERFSVILCFLAFFTIFLCFLQFLFAFSQFLYGIFIHFILYELCYLDEFGAKVIFLYFSDMKIFNSSCQKISDLW